MDVVDEFRPASVSLVGRLVRSRRVVAWSVCVLGIVAVLLLQRIAPGSAWIPQFDLPLGATATLLVFLTALACEYIDSALGMGYGTTLTPLLLLAGFSPAQIVPTVLLSECITGLIAGLLHHRDGNIDFLRDKKAQRTAILLCVLSTVGAVAGVSVALSISRFWLTAMIASIVLAVGVLILATLHRQLRYRPGHVVLIGGIAAFNKALSGGGYGPLVTGGQVVSGMSGKSAVAITSLAESLTCLVGLIAYSFASGALYWPLGLPLIAGAVLSVPIATLTVRRIPEHLMRGSVGVATCALGLLMFAKLLGLTSLSS